MNRFDYARPASVAEAVQAGTGEQVRYLAGGTPFGPVTSRNLTPNAQGRPAGYTYNQFLRVLRTGRDLKNLPPHVPSEDNDLLQVMPWPVYQDMIEHDIRAIYEYLRSIPHRDGFPE